MFSAEVDSALESAQESAVCVGWVEVHLYHCVSSVSADVFVVPCWQGRHLGVWF